MGVASLWWHNVSFTVHHVTENSIVCPRPYQANSKEIIKALYQLSRSGDPPIPTGFRAQRVNDEESLSGHKVLSPRTKPIVLKDFSGKTAKTKWTMFAYHFNHYSYSMPKYVCIDTFCDNKHRCRDCVPFIVVKSKEILSSVIYKTYKAMWTEQINPCTSLLYILGSRHIAKPLVSLSSAA